MVDTYILRCINRFSALLSNPRRQAVITKTFGFKSLYAALRYQTLPQKTDYLSYVLGLGRLSRTELKLFLRLVNTQYWHLFLQLLCVDPSLCWEAWQTNRVSVLVFGFCVLCIETVNGESCHKFLFCSLHIQYDCQKMWFILPSGGGEFGSFLEYITISILLFFHLNYHIRHISQHNTHLNIHLLTAVFIMTLELCRRLKAQVPSHVAAKFFIVVLQYPVRHRRFSNKVCAKLKCLISFSSVRRLFNAAPYAHDFPLSESGQVQKMAKEASIY